MIPMAPRETPLSGRKPRQGEREEGEALLDEMRQRNDRAGTCESQADNRRQSRDALIHRIEPRVDAFQLGWNGPLNLRT